MDLIKQVFESVRRSEEERRREEESEQKFLWYVMAREIDAERMNDPFWGGF